MPSVDTALVVKSLMGDLVDVEKMSPDPSGVHVMGQSLRPVRTKRRVRKLDDKTVDRIGAGIGVVSSAIGTKEIIQGAGDVRRARAANVGSTAKVRRIAMAKPAAMRVGGGTVLLAGDVLGTLALKQRADGRVEKGVLRSGFTPIPKLVKARVASMKSAMGLGPKTAPGMHVNPTPTPTPPGAPRGAVPSEAKGPLPPGAQASMATGAARREKVEDFARSTPGKLTIGAGAAYGAYAAGQSNGKKSAYGYYAKNDVVDVGIEGTFSKFDDEKRRAYGWASVVTMDGEPVVDRQGDYIGLDDIEEAAYAYVRKSRVTGDMHRRTAEDTPHKVGELIESVVFTPDKCHSMGLPASFAGRWWMGVQVEDDEAWQEVKKGNRTGFSIHGKGLRKDTTLDEIRAGR